MFVPEKEKIHCHFSYGYVDVTDSQIVLNMEIFDELLGCR